MAFNLDQVMLDLRVCLCNNVNEYDKSGVGGYLYRDLYLKSYEMGLKITL